MGTQQGSDSGSGERDLVRAALQTAFDENPKTGRKVASNRPRPLSFDPKGDPFPGYSLEREIHRGAQGVVYQAVQKGTGRRVAIKVLRQGPFATAHEMVRFEREVQILCQLKHPNIVSIHDSGVSQGHSFLVMDHVNGRSLNDFAVGVRRSNKETLHFFVKICEAVNAAHLQGVIHRDLKPSNILVDSDGEPQVLDFGLAKLVNQHPFDEPDQEPITITGQFIGSLPWASPEQAEGNQVSVDIRSDVYSLGVILYRLLTGRFPYRVVGKMQEVVANILNAEPLKPSSLDPRIDDEVETIVLKSLSKEPSRRYQSAGELSRDIQHYLNGEPIEAKRASSWYVLRKTLRRHRFPVFAACAFVVVLFGSAVALSILYRDAVLARVAESSARRDAESEAEKAKEVQEFLHNMLTSADPMQFKGMDLTVREVLDAAAKNVDTQFKDQPDVELALRNVLGVTYRSLGDYPAAEVHLQRAVQIAELEHEKNHPAVLTSWHNLAELLHHQGQLKEAEELYRQTYEARRLTLGEVHPDTINSLHGRAVVLRAQSQYGPAEEIAREVLSIRRREFGEEDSHTLDSMNTLAWILKEKGNLAESRTLFAQVLEIRQKVEGKEHPNSLTAMNNLATIMQDQGERASAEALYREALEFQRRVWGEEHPYVLSTMNNLADLLRVQGKFGEAEQFFRPTLEARRRVLGNQHQHTLTSMNNLGLVLQQLGNKTEAESLYRESLQGRKLQLGEDHPETWNSMSNLATLLMEQGKLDEAETIQREVLESRRGKLGAQHMSTLIAMNNLGAVLRQKGMLEESTSLAKEAWENAKSALPANHPNTFAFEGNYAKCLILQKRYVEAEPLIVEAYSGLEGAVGREHAHTQRMVKLLIEFYELTGRTGRAIELHALVIDSK